MPSHIVIGAGVNGLSVAWALAERGAEVLVLDKGRIGAGASGIAGGIVRNFYRAEAITELVRLSVEMFEEDAEAYGFRQVGYVAAVPEAQADDLVAIRAQHERAGYESELVTGAESCREYLSWTWPDWEAPVEALLHERRGGWADSMQTIRRLAERARAAGAEIREGVEVVGFETSGAEVETVVTDAGRIPCGTLVLAPGPWAARLWHLLGLDPYVDVGGERRPLLEYWKAQEGEFALKGAGLSGRAGIEAPVVHLDQAGPLRSDARRQRPRRGGLGHLLPHGPDRHRDHGWRPAGALERPWLGSLRPGQPRARRRAGLPRLLHVGPRLRAAALSRPVGGLAAHGGRRHRRPYARQLPGLRLGARQHLRDRRFRPRLQDARHRAPRGRRHRRRGRRRASSRSASGASPAAICWSPRGARIRGPETGAPQPCPWS